jgi:putative phosphoribosyl transferase
MTTASTPAQTSSRTGGVRIKQRSTRYTDRVDAGQALARELRHYSGDDDVVVLGLPRGGVPVAAQVADALGVLVDALIVCKLGLPEQPELAMGAVAQFGNDVELVRNESVLRHGLVSAEAFERVYRAEVAELQRRNKLYREGRSDLQVADRVVIVVDDGLATGSTMRAAVAVLRRQQPARIVVAAPVGATETCERLRKEVHEVCCPWTPIPFWAVGDGYRDFTPTPDKEVRRLLATGNAGQADR